MELAGYEPGEDIGTIHAHEHTLLHTLGSPRPEKKEDY